jgi:hypothetical protein
LGTDSFGAIVSVRGYAGRSEVRCLRWTSSALCWSALQYDISSLFADFASPVLVVQDGDAKESSVDNAPSSQVGIEMHAR